MNDDVSKAIAISIYDIIRKSTENTACFSIHGSTDDVTRMAIYGETSNAIHDTVMLATHNPIILGIQEATTINKI